MDSHGLTKQKPSRAFHTNYIQRLQQLSNNAGATEEDQQRAKQLQNIPRKQC
jgi:hypothetical protein